MNLLIYNIIRIGTLFPPPFKLLSKYVTTCFFHDDIFLYDICFFLFTIFLGLGSFVRCSHIVALGTSSLMLVHFSSFDDIFSFVFHVVFRSILTSQTDMLPFL